MDLSKKYGININSALANEPELKSHTETFDAAKKVDDLVKASLEAMRVFNETEALMFSLDNDLGSTPTTVALESRITDYVQGNEELGLEFNFSAIPEKLKDAGKAIFAFIKKIINTIKEYLKKFFKTFSKSINSFEDDFKNIKKKVQDLDSNSNPIDKIKVENKGLLMQNNTLSFNHLRENIQKFISFLGSYSSGEFFYKDALKKPSTSDEDTKKLFEDTANVLIFMERLVQQFNSLPGDIELVIIQETSIFSTKALPVLSVRNSSAKKTITEYETNVYDSQMLETLVDIGLDIIDQSKKAKKNYEDYLEKLHEYLEKFNELYKTYDEIEAKKFYDRNKSLIKITTLSSSSISKIQNSTIKVLQGLLYLIETHISQHTK